MCVSRRTGSGSRLFVGGRNCKADGSDCISYVELLGNRKPLFVGLITHVKV